MQTLIKILLEIWEILLASSAWLCVWSWIGFLLGERKGRARAGAWLGFLFGPFGLYYASRLEDPRQRRIPGRRTSEMLRAQRAAVKAAIQTPKPPETEMEVFERRFEAGQAAARRSR